jgi:hypothetical protein
MVAPVSAITLAQAASLASMVGSQNMRLPGSNAVGSGRLGAVGWAWPAVLVQQVRGMVGCESANAGAPPYSLTASTLHCGALRGTCVVAIAAVIGSSAAECCVGGSCSFLVRLLPQLNPSSRPTPPPPPTHHDVRGDASEPRRQRQGRGVVARATYGFGRWMATTRCLALQV